MLDWADTASNSDIFESSSAVGKAGDESDVASSAAADVEEALRLNGLIAIGEAAASSVVAEAATDPVAERERAISKTSSSKLTLDSLRSPSFVVAVLNVATVLDESFCKLTLSLPALLTSFMLP